MSTHQHSQLHSFFLLGGGGLFVTFVYIGTFTDIAYLSTERVRSIVTFGHQPEHRLNTPPQHCPHFSRQSTLGLDNEIKHGKKT